MTFGTHSFGSRTFGDSAPTGAGVMDSLGPGAVEMSATLTLGSLGLAAVTTRTHALSASFTLGPLFVGSSDDPGGGVGGDGTTTGGAVAVEVVQFRNMTLPFEYEFRFGDLYKEMGFTYEQATVLEERDRQLEDFILGFMPDLTFTLPGPLTESTSPRFYIRSNYRVDTWIASVATTGSTDTVGRVLVSGVATVPFTIPAGENMVEVSRYALLRRDDDYVQVEITTAGGAAEDLCVQGILRR